MVRLGYSGRWLDYIISSYFDPFFQVPNWTFQRNRQANDVVKRDHIG